MKKVLLPKSRAPVRLNSDPIEFAPRRIVVPIDFSELAEAALQRAATIARKFDGQLMLVNAVEPIIQPVEFAIVPADLQDINVRQLATHRHRLEALQKRLTEDGLRCRVEAKLGRPWQIVVDTAKRWKADLIVIPTHGRTGAKHFLLGSTAERVVQHASCSVLVVR
jgi:universal stress protein A